MSMKKQDWIDVVRSCMRSRFMDMIEEQELVPAGKITYQFSSRGHELIQVLLGRELNHGHDAATVYYRSRPFVLEAGLSLVEGFASPMGTAQSINGGRDIGVVHNMPPRKGVTVLPTSGDVGAQYTPALGWAQAAVYRSTVMKEKDWKGAVAVALGGDGSTATNGFWAALNVATTQTLPMVFFIEDNGYGISVPSRFQTPGGNIADNLAAFKGLKILDIDGTDPEEAQQGIHDSVSHARNGKGPVLLRMRVPRLCGHSGADNQSYKTDDERKSEEARDPLQTLKTYMSAKKYLTAKDWEATEKEVEAEVRDALETALKDAQPDPATAKQHIMFEGVVQTVGGAAAENAGVSSGTTEIKETEKRRLNLVESVKRTLETEMNKSQRVLVFGEDVGVKGGVHGATVDLQVKMGADRVFDTSLSEEAIIGRAVGMAQAGLMPVPEIQFRKYADPAHEQISDCGTIRWRTNNRFAAPLVVRIPCGYSKMTGDPWHSVSGEAIFSHLPGWKVAMPRNARDAAGLLRTALRGNDPVVFLEHRALLDTSPGRSPWPGDEYVLEFGQAEVVQEGTDATIVAWGAMVHLAEKAAKKAGISCEIVDLRTMVPWDKETVLKSVRKTGRCLVVHEDTYTAGLGGDVVSAVSDEAFTSLDAPVMRLATPDVPVPYNPGLMKVVVPNEESIAAKLKDLVAF